MSTSSSPRIQHPGLAQKIMSAAEAAALIPAGASVTVAASGVDAGDTFQAVAYQSSKALGDGWMEMTHELASISEAMVKVKLTLGGNSASRPRVRNLRVIVL